MKNLSLTLFRDSELLPLLLASAVLICGIELIFRFLPERKKKTETAKTSSLAFVHPSVTVPSYTKKDIHAIVLITALYALVSLWQCGSNTFPTTTWQPQKDTADQSFILELTDSTAFDQINVLYEEGDNNSNQTTWQLGVEGMKIEGSNDLSNWQSISTLNNNGIYEYQIIEGEYDYRYIRITSVNPNQTLTEIAFKKSGEDVLLPVKVYEDDCADTEYPALLVIDEQDKAAIHPSPPSLTGIFTTCASGCFCNTPLQAAALASTEVKHSLKESMATIIFIYFQLYETTALAGNSATKAALPFKEILTCWASPRLLTTKP